MENIVTIDLMDKFPSQYPCKSFFNYVSNLVGLEGVLSVAGLFTPELIIENNCIFLKENYPVISNNQLYKKFGNDTKTLERHVNLFCVSEFYLLAADEASQDEFLLLEFARIIQSFWQMYLNHQFPEKEFDFELHENGFFDEDGLCITFSQR